jgi:hypothetical protein
VSNIKSNEAIDLDRLVGLMGSKSFDCVIILKVEMDDIIDILPILHLIPRNEEFFALYRLYAVYIQEIDEQIVEELLPVLLSMDLIVDSFHMLLSVYRDWVSLKAPITRIILDLFPQHRNGYTEMWPHLVENGLRFWHLTGETNISASIFNIGRYNKPSLH